MIFVTGFFTDSFLPSFGFPELEKERERDLFQLALNRLSRGRQLLVLRVASVELAK